MIKSEIKKWIDAYNRTGRSAFYYPRLKRISLNGFRSLPENEAILKIKEILSLDQEQKS